MFVALRAIEQALNLRELALAELEDDPAVRAEVIERLARQALMDAQTVRSRIEGFARLVVEEKRTIFLQSSRRNERGRAHDDVHLAAKAETVERAEHVTDVRGHSVLEAMLLRIFFGETHRTLGDVGRVDARLRQGVRERDADIAGARSHVDSGDGGVVVEQLSRDGDEHLADFARDENARFDEHLVAAEGDGSAFQCVFYGPISAFHPFLLSLGCPLAMEIAGKIRKFITSNFYVPVPAELADETSLLDSGVIDSTGVLEVISFIEHEFGIEVADEEMLPENLDSIARIAAYVSKKKN